MSFPIGAMSIGDILDRGLKVLLARLPALAAISLILYLPLMVLQILMPVIVYREGYDLNRQAITLMLFSLAQLAVTVLVQPFAQAAAIHVVASEFLDKPVTIGQALAFALSRFFSLLGATFVFSVVVLAPLLLGTILGSLLMGVLVAALDLPGLALGLLALLLFLAAGAAGSLLLFARFYLYAQVVVVEGSLAMPSFPRSAALTEGFRWRMQGILGLLVVISLVISMTPAFLLNHLLPYLETHGTGLEITQVFTSYRNYLIQVFVQYPLSTIIHAYSAVCWTLLYFDLRIRKEGFDLELAARGQLGSAEDLPPLVTRAEEPGQGD